MNRKGAFLISREIFENAIWTDVVKFRIFFYIVGNAVFSEEGVEIGGIHIKRGQLLRSFRNLSDDLQYIENRKVKKYSVSVISRKVEQLVKENRLKIESTELGTLFTVVNYDLYQGLNNYRNDNLEQRWNSAGTVLEQSGNNNNNDKNDNNVNNNTLRSKFKFETHHMKLAELLFKKIRENNPSAKEPNLKSWANTFRLMMERDKREGKEIQDLILWTQQHHFWYKNILSADKLRKQYDRLLLEMKDEHQKMPFKVVNGGKQNEIRQSSYGADYSKYDFSKMGNVSWLQDES